LEIVEITKKLEELEQLREKNK